MTDSEIKKEFSKRLNLQTEYLGDNKIVNKQKPLVSVCVETYNHEKYIKQCLDSLIYQKTDFEFEIIIGQDGSNDNTGKICEEYAKKHQDKIRLFNRDRKLSQLYDEEGKFVCRFNAKWNRQSARGKYIARCEGDDCWTDLNKLQRQVNFLENNKDYALCFHPVKVIYENSKKLESIYPEPGKFSEFTVEKLLRGNYIQTNSVMYRKQKYENLPLDVMPGDWYLNLYHAQFGKIGFIDEIMSLYRIHEKGLWQDSYKNKDRHLKNHATKQFKLYIELLKIYNTNKYKNIIYESIATLLGDLQKINKTTSKKIIEEIATSYPEELISIILELNRNFVQLNQGYEEVRQEKNSYKEELKSIKSTKGWKVFEKYYRIRK